jgi:hypothetical protein
MSKNGAAKGATVKKVAEEEDEREKVSSIVDVFLRIQAFDKENSSPESDVMDYHNCSDTIF